MVRSHRRPVHLPGAADGQDALGLPQVQREQRPLRPAPRRVHRPPRPHHALDPAPDQGPAYREAVPEHDEAADDGGPVREYAAVPDIHHCTLQTTNYAYLPTGTNNNYTKPCFLYF